MKGCELLSTTAPALLASVPLAAGAPPDRLDHYDSRVGPPPLLRTWHRVGRDLQRQSPA